MNAPHILPLMLLLSLAWAPVTERREHAPRRAPPPVASPQAALVPVARVAPPQGPPTTPAFREPGPDVAVIDDLVDHYGPVVFDHRLHEQMSEITGDCSNCHHESPTNESITGCAQCHPLKRDQTNLRVPSLKGAFHRQCLSCHKEWSRANSCGFCHQEAGAAMHGPEDFGEYTGELVTHISPHTTYTYHTERKGLPVVTFHHEDHVQAFGLSCADCHHDDACERCHGAGTATRVVDRERDCVSCHAGNDCVTCHDLGEKPRFNHGADAGWVLGEGHADAACAACHGPSHQAALAEPTSLRCLACHADAHGTGFESDMGAVALLGSHSSFECVQCHKGGADGTHATCTECHDARSYPNQSPGLIRQPESIPQ